MPPLTAQPLADFKELDDLRASMNINVSQPERIGSIAAGAALAAYGLSRRSLGGVLLAALGGLLVRRGITGHCEMYENLGINSRQLRTESGVPGNKGIKVIKSVVVNRPREEVYRYWRNLENLPRFMEHVESVREIDNRRSAWVVRGPMAHDVEWTAEIITDRENELIAWQSLPGAEVQNAGSVWFEPVNGGAATEVKVSIQYQPPAGVLGAAVAKIFGEAPEQQLENDLAKFKSLIEGGSTQPTPTPPPIGVAGGAL
ncbi:MAG TPA: SRPBCC family protein [Chthoniobacterales bacterium]|nr:SRPBCC family protein [Chthoniobacterales bacterium]